MIGNNLMNARALRRAIDRAKKVQIKILVENLGLTA